MAEKILVMLLLVAAIAVVILLERRYRRHVCTPGSVAEIVLIGGPMDGRKVLACIGGVYVNYAPIPTGWRRHEYRVRPGGWGLYVGSVDVPYKGKYPTKPFSWFTRPQRNK